MTTPKSKYPVASFGPELMAFLLACGRGRKLLVFHSHKVLDEGGKEEWDGSGKKKAHNFQKRIHTLRSKMRDEKHRDYPFAARTKVSIFWGPAAVREGGPSEWVNDHKGDRGAIIVGRPFDTEFTDVLKQAGVEVDLPTLPPPDSPSPQPEEVSENPPGLVPVKDILDEIWPDVEKK